MSGHSKWATIKRKKGAIDAKRGALFTKAAKEITVAAKAGGGEQEMNPRLRTAVIAAKSVNMPNANIERAIKRGTGEIEGVSYDEVSYEGYAAGGVAVFVEALTDKRTRTFPEVRKIFEKCGGKLGNNGAVAHMFTQKGVFVVDAGVTEEDALMEVVLEAGGEDLEAQDDGAFEITCAPTDFNGVASALEEAAIPTISAKLEMIPSLSVEVSGKPAEQVLRLVGMLEDHDDVQSVWSNFDIDDETMASIT